MEPRDLKKFFQKQVSLTEWFEEMNHPSAAALRVEDNEKRERLRVLQERIGLPYDKPYQFSATDMAARTPEFVAFLDEHGDELCSLRLIPNVPDLPKLRMRGHSIRQSLEWFAEQGVDPEHYKADFAPHIDNVIWSTIFVVRPDGIFGELIRGGHHQLTQGFFEKERRPITFSYDFSEWHMSPIDPEALAEMQNIVEQLMVTDGHEQEFLAQTLQAEFSHNILCGYFETTSSEEFGRWFIDYNRILVDLLSPVSVQLGVNDSGELRGQTGSGGKVRGRVRLVLDDDLAGVEIENDEILVCPVTTPSHISLMVRAAAIVTDSGGILSHAAIVARELKKPCIVGTVSATQILRDGDMIEVDADAGVILML